MLKVSPSVLGVLTYVLTDKCIFVSYRFRGKEVHPKHASTADQGD